ncbi:MAG: 7-cyano-7-deazaguanine synthase QueC [Bacteroidetes bacterium]|nr:7-cyano-7-deazaguanine synthase QueC [Bacteroidota bacterium]
MIKNKKAIVLVSGGMDSLLTLAIAIKQDVEPYTLHVNYGQNTQQKELKAYKNINNYYNIGAERSLIVDIDYLKKIGGSTLLGTSFNIKKNDKIPNSYVPFRNANILSIAVSWAEVIGANYIFIGASEVDFSGYPDCRREFFDVFEKTIELGTRPDTKIKILTPLISMTKEDIVRKGVELDIPFELSWSCYYNEEYACGECPSCKLRINGFKKAKVNDPIKYSSIL